MMAWVDALRAIAKDTGKWHIPKKGTKEYDRVKAYQMKGYEVEGEEIPSQTKPKAKRGRPAKPKAPEAPKEMKMKRSVKMDKEGGMKITLKARKERADKGKARGPSIQKIAAESYKQGLVSKKDAGIARKVRSDKGKKRGARKPKEVKTEASEEMFYYA